MVTLKLSVLPAFTVCTDVGPVNPKSGGVVVPVPVSPTVCGLPAALSVMVKVPVRVPAAVGVKVTLIMQFALAASIAGSVPQVFVSAKSPEVPIVLIVRGPVPVFVSVTVCAELGVFSNWLPKVRVVGASITAGAGFAPIPLSAMFCGLVLSPSVRTSVPGLDPTADGVKVTLTVQVLVAPKGMLPPHVLVAA